MFRSLFIAASAFALAARADYSDYDISDVEAAYCQFAATLTGTVVLPNAKCCGGLVAAVDADCPDEGDNNNLNYTMTEDVVMDDCNRRKPSAVFAMRTASDVSATVKFLTHFDHEFSVRSGGHSQVCASTCDGCAVISTILMKEQKQVESCVDDTVFLVAQPGVTLNEAYYGYAETDHMILHGVMPTVALGGHYLGGGMGYFTRMYGFGLDYVVGVEIVLVTGEIVRVFDDAYELELRGYKLPSKKHSRLLWALKGSGHAGFGIVTKYWIKMIKTPQYVVTGGVKYNITSVDDMRSVWGATCGYMGHNECNGVDTPRLNVWPRILPMADYAVGKAPRLRFDYWYVPEDQSSEEAALAEGTAEIEKYLSFITLTPESKSIFVTAAKNIHVNQINIPQVSGEGTCASKNVLDKRDICENAEWLDTMANMLYEWVQLPNWLYQGEHFYYVFEQWGGAASTNDPYFKKTSMSSRHTWGTINYCRWPLSSAIPRSVIYNKTETFNKDMLLPISDVYYGNYVDFMVEDIRQVYSSPTVYHRVKALKQQYDPTYILDQNGTYPALF